jgi:hypothetical protein
MDDQEDAGQASSDTATSAVQPHDVPANDSFVAKDTSVGPDLAPMTEPEVGRPDKAGPPDVLASSDAPVADLAVPDTLVATPKGPEAGRDATGDSGLASFCTGGASRMVLNGEQSSPAVTARVIPLDCCQGAEFQITAPTFYQPITIWWQAQSMTYKTIDLASLPAGWQVSVATGCESTMSCETPRDAYASGLLGSLAIMPGKRGTYDMSICVHLEEHPDAPHADIHTLDFYAPHITTID